MQSGEMLCFVAKVVSIFFQNSSNFYKVLLVRVQETTADFHEQEIVVTGSFGDIQKEEWYRFYGELVDHPKYGRQLKVERYEKEKPMTVNGVVSYLSSDKFPGIGKKTAEKIVELLGEDAIEKIITDPLVLKQVSGLTKSKREMIAETIRLNHEMDQVIMGLNSYGFGSQLAFSIYQVYKNESLNIVEENPYRLVEEIDGIGFKRADNLAEKIGIDADSPRRIRAAILYQIFQHSIQTGDTYVSVETLLKQTIDVLETSRSNAIKPDQVKTVIIQLVKEGKIQKEETNIYENSLYFSEWGIGSSIQRFLSRKIEINYSEQDVKKNIRRIEKIFDIQYGQLQEQAIAKAVCSSLFILTGGPGTGKTTVINGIIHLFAELNNIDLDLVKYTQNIFPILLTAPTGRAAKRMKETTGLPASTIHRLLRLNGRNKTFPIITKELEGGLLIVDEMSMVDTWLANRLFQSIPTNMQVILVGDKDQLPSVGPGQVLRDLLEIEQIPKIELNKIYRQGDRSSIIPLAHEIKKGYLPADFTINQKDRSFFQSNVSQIEPLISKIVEKAKKKGFRAQDIQVLAPIYRGEAGIDVLNKMMQEIFNPGSPNKKEVHWNETVYRIGDKVLQLVNTPELNIFNGDIGEITSIILAKDSEDKVDKLVIKFDEDEVTYKRNEWNKITLSYCCSIHKSQGNEFKMVILPMVHQYQRMLQRNLLYTAVTRSKEVLILLGEEQSYATCVANESASRLTTLKKRIEGNSEISLSIRTKLAAYENSLIGNDPFKDLTYKETTIKKAAEVSRKKKSKDTQLTKRDINEDWSFLAEESTKIIPKTKDIAVNKESKCFILTTEAIVNHWIDPMIGMENN